MDIIVRVNNQSNGRDKLARLVQYTSRLVWHQLQMRKVNEYSIDRIRTLESSLSSFRKILGLGRFIDLLYTSMECLHYEDPCLRVTLTVSKVAQALYRYADNIVWLTRSGFLKTETDWTKTASKFWLISIIANLVRDFYEILKLAELNKSTLIRPSDLLSKTIKNFDLSMAMKHLFMTVNCHKDIFVDTLKNSCDLFIPLTTLGFTKLSPSQVGTLGAISSIAALVTMVKPITKLVPS